MQNGKGCIRGMLRAVYILCGGEIGSHLHSPVLTDHMHAHSITTRASGSILLILHKAPVGGKGAAQEFSALKLGYRSGRLPVVGVFHEGVALWNGWFRA